MMFLKCLEKNISGYQCGVYGVAAVMSGCFCWPDLAYLASFRDIAERLRVGCFSVSLNSKLLGKSSGKNVGGSASLIFWGGGGVTSPHVLNCYSKRSTPLKTNISTEN